MRPPTALARTFTAFGLPHILIAILFTIGVAGVVAALVIPELARIRGPIKSPALSRYEADRSNAQKIVEAANAAIAAGYSQGWPSRAALVDSLSGPGVTVQLSSGPVASFRVPPLSPMEQAGACQFLSLDPPNKVTFHDPATEGGAPAPTN